MFLSVDRSLPFIRLSCKGLPSASTLAYYCRTVSGAEKKFYYTDVTGRQSGNDFPTKSSTSFRCQNGATTSSIMTFSTMTLGMKGLIHDTQYNITLLPCWVTLCCVSHFICCYAECRDAVCRCAECCGTIKSKNLFLSNWDIRLAW